MQANLLHSMEKIQISIIVGCELKMSSNNRDNNYGKTPLKCLSVLFWVGLYLISVNRMIARIEYNYDKCNCEAAFKYSIVE